MRSCILRSMATLLVCRARRLQTRRRPTAFSQGWTTLVRLFDLQCVIAELTASEAHHVKRLDPTTWGTFLQILEDAAQRSTSSRWIISVLYSTDARNATTRAAMNQLLTANDPGDAATVGGTLHALSHEEVTCHNCDAQGYFARECKQPRNLNRWQQPQCVGFSVSRDGLNVLAQNAHVQYGEQEQQTAEISDLRNHVTLQNMLLRDEGGLIWRLDQEQARTASAGGGVLGGAVAQMEATSMRPTASTQLLIMGSPQLEGYVYIGSHHHGRDIWGSMDTVAASMMEAGAAGNAAGT